MEPHHHLVCLTCNELLDVRPNGERHLHLPSDQQHGYELLDVDIVFRGRCPRCQRRPRR